MYFDFCLPGQVSITAENSEHSILSECGIWPLMSPPAAPTLFKTRDAPKAITEEVDFFLVFVAKLLYLAERVKPEGLVAVAFLITRVHEVDEDAMGKLRHLLGYLRATLTEACCFVLGITELSAPILMNHIRCLHQGSGNYTTESLFILVDVGVLDARSTKKEILTNNLVVRRSW